MAKSNTVEVSFFTETDEGFEREIFVEATFYPGRPAQLYGAWEDCSPEEICDVEVISAVTEDGQDYELNEGEIEKIEELVMGKLRPGRGNDKKIKIL